MTFLRKQIELTITLGSGEFGADEGDRVTIRDRRIFADVINPGGETMGSTQIRVYGLPFDMMNKLTTIGQINRAVRIANTVQVAAGDADGMQLIFSGVIADAWAEYNNAPDVPFMIMAQTGLGAALKPVGATGYRGQVSVIDIMVDLAAEAGVTLEGEDPEIFLSNPYFPGSALNKIRACARAAGIEYNLDRGVLAIWKRGKARETGSIIEINSDNGMIGYPTLSSKGLVLRTEFNPNIKMGGKVEVTSTLPMANGIWTVYNYVHNISMEAPGGPWETILEATRVEP